jgi:hypothetical protein
MPAVETIEWGGRVWRRYPESKRRSHRVYYQSHAKWKGTPLYLHRELWKSVHGEIPDGHEIHHRDDNPLNNAIDNLECLPLAEHRRRHPVRMDDWRMGHLEAIRGKAAEWHRSEEGREWHRKHARECAGKRVAVALICTVCGSPFKSKRPDAKFCGQKCRDRGRAERVATHECECGWCGGKFLSLKPAQRFCSYSCSGRARWEARRARV